jgi:hypothetical protein
MGEGLSLRRSEGQSLERRYGLGSWNATVPKTRS